VPFVKGEAEPYIPRCLLNKTNAQLWSQYASPSAARSRRATPSATR
jgi:hypothetical protein